jgi:hypothetical protein
VGDQATLPGLGRKLLQLKYGLTGRIPDGMLFRVSSLNTKYATAYGDQESFINELLDSVTQENKIRLIGKIS